MNIVLNKYLQYNQIDRTRNYRVMSDKFQFATFYEKMNIVPNKYLQYNQIDRTYDSRVVSSEL